MKKILLILLLISIPLVLFAQDSTLIDSQTKEVSEVLATIKMVLSSTKKSEIINQVSDLITDLYSYMYKDLLKKGFTEKQAMELLTGTIRKVDQVVREIDIN